jgi:hypothetical protein
MDKDQRKYFCKRIDEIYRLKELELDDKFYENVDIVKNIYNHYETIKKELARSGRVKPTKRKFFIFNIKIENINFDAYDIWKNSWYNNEKYFEFDEKKIEQVARDARQKYLETRQNLKEALEPYRLDAVIFKDAIMSMDSGMEVPALLAKFEDICKKDA